ncbi:proline-rich receptor-like protein kinase PERK2 [Onychomys torridus]|uniref:proline-rich receptor-like protein kinase PERK2 n=1 Tax=Onychomys torridus TaxID=38674 RepID=UPI00167F344D|nr:proline-rich receptor-like protein kinase PERK2 [Onychomys torridus]
MAGSRLLPLALALLLLVRPGDSSAVLVLSGVAFTVFWESMVAAASSSAPEPTPDPTSVLTSPTSSPTSPTSSPTSLTSPTPDSSSTGANPGSVSPEPETASLPSSGSPGSELSTVSQSTSSVLQGSPTVSSPGQDAGSLWIPTSHRNPGVVIAVCLLVSVLLIGSVFTAVRRCNRDAPAFHNLDTVSMGSVSQRLPFADRLQS